MLSAERRKEIKLQFRGKLIEASVTTGTIDSYSAASEYEKLESLGVLDFFIDLAEKAAAEEILKFIHSLGNVDEVWSQSQKKMVCPWTIEGIAVLDMVESELKKKFGVD